MKNNLSPLKMQLSEMEKYLVQPHQLNLKVSQWSRFMHLEHILVSNNQIIDFIEVAAEPDPKTRKLILGYLILCIGYIPRGVADAPKNVVPTGKNHKELQLILNLFLEKLKQLEKNMDYNKNLKVGKHPYFGDLTTDECISFMEIHTKYHLKIVN